MKKVIVTLVSLVLFTFLAGCAKSAAPAESASTTPDTQTSAPDAQSPSPDNQTSEAPSPADESKIIGSSIQYDTGLAVHNGEEIEVELWFWTGASNLFESFANKYMAIHPNVKIKLVENPWDDYWTKLPLALQGSDGPAVFNVHNSQHDNLIGYMAPYDIPPADLENDFLGVSAHVIDGKVFYIDYSLMTASIYYNTDMWSEAGLTEADIPATWDQFREVAKKLTKKENGAITQAGFNYNGGLQGKILGMNYQQGINLFKPDNTINLNNEAIVNSIKMFTDMYKVDGVCDDNFGNNAGDSFGQGLTAMIMDWGFMTNSFNTNFPDIHYGVFEIPVPSSDTPYAYYRYNGESTWGVNKNASEAQQAVAQDMVRYFLADDDIQIEFSLANATFPAKYSLAQNADLMAVPAIAALSKHIDRYIWPGPMPDLITSNLTIALEDIIYNNVDIESALKNAEDMTNQELANLGFVSLEPQYKYAAEAKQ